MPLDLLVLGAAFLTGLLGSAHCAAMCGGIAVATALPARPRASWPERLWQALAPSLGRIGSYTLAGAAVGGLGAGLLGALDLEAAGPWLRTLIGAVLLLAAVRLAVPHWALRLPSGPAAPLWQGLAPLRRAVPASGPWRPLALGALWGWLPCGLSYTLLAAAWLEGSALHGGLLMLAFGLGTLPALMALAAAGLRWGLPQGGWRYAGATLIGGAGLLTLAAPWLVQVPVLHAALAALGCRSLGG
jgi:sulfite exporter TauE/SafE